MDLEAVVGLGEKLGYKEEALQQFVKQEMARQEQVEVDRIAREERAREREAKASERESKLREEELDIERERLEVEKMRLKQVESEREFQETHRLDILEKELELEQAKQATKEELSVSHDLHHVTSSVRVPKMPKFDEDKDSIDSYLNRFERVAKAQQWEEGKWATYLSTLLKGKALEGYCRMSVEDAGDYKKMKATLLKCYDLTEEGFRQKFREAHIDKGETFSQYVVRIEGYLMRWVELSQTENSFEGVKELLLKEQILNIAGKDLNVFLRERKPETAKQMALLAEQYLDARTATNEDTGKYLRKAQISDDHKKKVESGKNTSDYSGNRQGFNPRRPFVYAKDRQCYLCTKRGHMARDCPQNKLEETVELAQEQLRKASGRYRRYYNRKAKDRQMQVGDKVLLLLPTDSNKLLLQWKGPFKVVEKFGNGNYRVDMQGKIKAFHANLLKKYVDRQEDAPDRDLMVASLLYVNCGLVDVDSEASSTDVKGSEEPEISAMPLEGKETVKDVIVSAELTKEQQNEVGDLLLEFSDVLTDLPGRTDCIEYKIKLNTQEPIRSKPYPIPHHMRGVVAKEIEDMLRLDVIEQSESPYASPIVLLKKKDNTYRFCTDYRKLNQCTVFDSEPIPHPEGLFTNLSKVKYLTKIDLTKGCWQIPMEETSKEMTAFVTPDGLYQWKVMPFGVVNAPAVFSRMMRLVLRGLEDIENFIDDILLGSESWGEHMGSLRKLLERLRAFHLTAKPSKCFVAHRSLEFVGHVVGDGQMKLEPGKVDKILNISKPQTKKQVRSFIGLTSYYRKFIPNFATLVAPLTDLTQKGKPNQVEWDEVHEKAFVTLKEKMSSFPILKLPDLSQGFLVRTDASSIGIGAVLLQEEEGEKFPVMYASRKLLPREKAYSTIERECLAIVWAVHKLERFLYGREFVLETDHEPLVWMTKNKVNNSRVMRWSLALQPYRFSLRGIKGVDNVGADLLSRCVLEE